jgi:cell division protein FtsZ
MIEFEQESLYRQKSMVSIKVIGVGGAGGNAVNSIIESGCQGIGFVVANTDAQVLEFSKAQHKIQIGVKSTKGLGAGANPEIGKRAAEEDLDKVMDAISGADIVFIVGGMGGGTGSGGLPVIARALREKGILSIAIVTRPFVFEGKRRAAVADAAIERLKQDGDTLIVIPNEKLLEVVDQHVSMIDAFAMINDGVLSQSVRGLSDIITRPGHINVDYADIRTIMKDRGLAVMGTGKASGIGRAREAALRAISSPLLENMSVVGAHGVLFNITGGKNLGLHEISEAASVVYEQAHEDANIIIGSVIDENLHDEVIVTIIATDFERPMVAQVQSQEEVSIIEPIKQPEAPIHVCASSFTASSENRPVIEEQESEVTPLPLMTEMEVSAAVEEKHEHKQQSDFFGNADTFGCARDSKDLDIPTFMRQKSE